MKTINSIVVLTLAVIGSSLFARAAFADLNDGLVAYYPLDGAAQDGSGNENHGVVHGGLSYVDGKVGQAARFNGNDAYVDVPYNPTMALSEWTISAWVHADSRFLASVFVAGKVSDARGRCNYALMISNGIVLSAAYETHESDFDHTLNARVAAEDQWNHVLALRSASGKHQLYINGVLKDSGRWLDHPAENEETFVIGRNTDKDLSRRRFLTGLLDEVRVYNRAVSETEIQEIYNHGHQHLLARVDFSPATFNLSGNREFITAFVEFSDSGSVGNIDVESVFVSRVNVKLLDIPCPSVGTEVGDNDGNGIADLAVRFDSRTILDAVDTGEAVEITVHGQFTDGKSFEARRNVRVIDKGKAKLGRAGLQEVRVRLAVYNVACGQWTAPEKVAQEMKKHDLDILGLNEMPRLIKEESGEQWCTRLARALEMPYVYSGTISSANHGAPRWVDESGKYEGKYKAILSKTPLFDTREFELTGGNWNPASAVRAVTVVRGVRFSFYSLHVNTHWNDLVKVFREDNEFHVFGGGDYNHSNYPEFDKAADMRDGRWDVEGKKSIDRIFYRPNGKVRCVFNDVIRPEVRMSDHPYAVSVFEFDSDQAVKNP